MYLVICLALYLSAGESTRSNGLRLTRNGHISTLWNRDQAAASTNVNLYGSHPILYDIREGRSLSMSSLSILVRHLVADSHLLAYFVYCL